MPRYYGEVVEYRTYLNPGKYNSSSAYMAMIALYDNDNKQVAQLRFYSPTSSYIDNPPNDTPYGYFIFNHHIDEYPNFIDLLRNEKPVYIYFSGTDYGYFSTSKEPIGEEEL
jgi:hypothetical protein